jgi:hypothetical protein
MDATERTSPHPKQNKYYSKEIITSPPGQSLTLSQSHSFGMHAPFVPQLKSQTGPEVAIESKGRK